MKKLGSVVLVLAAGATSLVLAGSAAGTTQSATKVRHVNGRIEALALDGSRIAYDVGATLGKADNKVLVWNVRTGRTVKVSGKRTARADGTSTGSGVLQLAIAGSRVAWLVNEGGNLEGTDYLFDSSLAQPTERHVATESRSGDACSGGPWASNPMCVGTWLGGLVGSGNLIALNRWATQGGEVTDGGLYALTTTGLKQVASGATTVEAVSADGGRVAVLRSDGTVGVYSSTGSSLLTVTPALRAAKEVALSGRNLVVLPTYGDTAALYDSSTGTLEKTPTVRGDTKQIRNLDVQGNIAIYTAGSSVHALNLSSGKDSVVGRLRGTISIARISTDGLVYSGGKTLVFLPFKRAAAAVAG